MDSQTLMIVVAVVVLLVVAAAAWMYYAKQSRARLRERFGPEYDRTVAAVGPDKAEAMLSERANRVDHFKIRPLTKEQADAFSRDWLRVQGLFVDDPDAAVTEADRLLTQVMTARGYPLEDFERRAEDISVDHPHVVENYRIAQSLVVKRQRGMADTEELRQAIVNYRSLFDDLLEVKGRDYRRAS